MPSVARACDDQSTVHGTPRLTAESYYFCTCAQSYFDLVFVSVCRITRRESSGYTFATTMQMYEVF